MYEFLLLLVFVRAQFQCGNGADSDAHDGHQDAHKDTNRQDRCQLKVIGTLGTALVRGQGDCKGKFN